MAFVTEVKHGGVESVTIKLTGKEAKLIRALTALGTIHLTADAHDWLKDQGLDPSPYTGGRQIHEALRGVNL